MGHTSYTIMTGISFILIFLSFTSLGMCCPLGWLDLDGSCYLIGPSTHKWFEAQVYCWDQGGYLAEVTSEEEFSLLEKYFLQDGVYYWIGLSDVASEGEFRWMESHGVLDWANWASNEPNNNGGDEDCVGMDGGRGHGWS